MNQPKNGEIDSSKLYEHTLKFGVIIFIFVGSRAKIVSIPKYFICKIEKRSLALESLFLKFCLNKKIVNNNSFGQLFYMTLIRLFCI